MNLLKGRASVEARPFLMPVNHFVKSTNVLH